PENASGHHSLKKSRGFISLDFAFMADIQAKVPASPGDPRALSDQSGCDSGYCALSCRRSAVHVQIDAQREEEASRGRSGDPRFELNCLHDYSPGLFCSTKVFALAIKSTSATLPSSPFPRVRTLT